MKKKNDVELHRVYEKPLSVFGKAVRVKKLILITIVGLTLGILGHQEMQSIIWAVFGVFNLVLLIILILLYQKSILHFGEYSLEATASGDMFITKLHGHCSKCDGHLKIIKKRKGLNEFITYIQCDKDEKHIWNAFGNEEVDKS